MRNCSSDILDTIFSFVNGTNYFYVNKFFYSIVKKRIKKLKLQIRLDYLNNNEPYCEPLGNLFEIDLSHSNDIFKENCEKFVNISIENHKIIMDYVFHGLSDDFYVAGGSIVGILKWNHMDNTKFKKSDIDIFYIGHNKNAPIDIFRTIKSLIKIDNRFKIVKTVNTLTLYHPTFRKIQFILKTYNSLHELFTFFDFDVVCVAYNNNNVICSFKTAVMLNQKWITMDYHYTDVFIERLRCHKYFRKGFDLIVKKETPYYDEYMYGYNGVKRIISVDDDTNINPCKHWVDTFQRYETIMNMYLNHTMYSKNKCPQTIKYNSKFPKKDDMLNKKDVININSHVNLCKFNYSEYDHIEKKLNDYIDNKCDNFVDTYTSDGIFFKETTYDNIHENEIEINDLVIKTTNCFDLKHLSIRYKIYYSDEYNGYYFL